MNYIVILLIAYIMIGIYFYCSLDDENRNILYIIFWPYFIKNDGDCGCE